MINSNWVILRVTQSHFLEIEDIGTTAPLTAILIVMKAAAIPKSIY
jgi:hypothetical protein